MGQSAVRQRAFNPPYRSYGPDLPGFVWIESSSAPRGKSEKQRIPACWYPVQDAKADEYGCYDVFDLS
jgi:hypothetical protein